MLTFLQNICFFIGICSNYENDKFVHKNSFATKTAYRDSFIPTIKPPKCFNDCQLIHVSTLFRHGTRYPSAEKIRAIKSLHKRLINQFNSSSNLPESFRKWKCPFSVTEENQLTSVGHGEMKDLGTRFKKLLSKNNGNKKMKDFVKIFSTSVQRSKDSAASFVESLLEIEKNEAENLIEVDDDKLRFYDKCPAYVDYILKKKPCKLEYDKFKNGIEMSNTVENFRKRWGLNASVTTEDIITLYTICTYEVATKMFGFKLRQFCVNGDHECEKQSSALCQLFENSDFHTLEYLQDLKNYWLKSFGSYIDWYQSCILLGPMIEHVKAAFDGHQASLDTLKTSRKTELDYKRGVFWFAHSATLIPIVAFFGLFEEELTANSFQKHLALIKTSKAVYETYKTAKFSPFSGNIAFELYHCPESESVSGRYKVQLRINGKLVQYSSGRDLAVMSLGTFLYRTRICSPELFAYNSTCLNGSYSCKIL